MCLLTHKRIKAASPKNTALKPDEASQQDRSLTGKVLKQTVFFPATLLMKPLFLELQLFFKSFSYTKFLILYFLFVNLYLPFGKNVLKHCSENHINNKIITNVKISDF